MKTPEDEAFDDLAKKQGDWGGGYQAKRAAAADKLQEPASYLHTVINAFGPDEGISLDQKAWSQLHAAIKTVVAQPVQEFYDQTALELCGECGWKTLIPGDGCLNCERAQPAQEPVAHILQFIKELRPAIGPMAGMGKSKTTQEWFDIVINEIERLQSTKEKSNG